MSLETISWLSMAAYAYHILEEYSFDWRNWARSALHLPVEWSDFYITNAIVIAFGIVQAQLAATLPLAPLSFAALMLINAVFFHILPFIRLKGRFSPGLFTAVVLFVPISLAAFAAALASKQVGWPTVGFSVLIGALTMAFPVVMLKLRSRRYFQQA